MGRLPRREFQERAEWGLGCQQRRRKRGNGFRRPAGERASHPRSRERDEMTAVFILISDHGMQTLGTALPLARNTERWEP